MGLGSRQPRMLTSIWSALRDNGLKAQYPENIVIRAEFRNGLLFYHRYQEKVKLLFLGRQRFI